MINNKGSAILQVLGFAAFSGFAGVQYLKFTKLRMESKLKQKITKKLDQVTSEIKVLMAKPDSCMDQFPSSFSLIQNSSLATGKDITFTRDNDETYKAGDVLEKYLEIISIKAFVDTTDSDSWQRDEQSQFTINMKLKKLSNPPVNTVRKFKVLADVSSSGAMISCISSDDAKVSEMFKNLCNAMTPDSYDNGKCDLTAKVSEDVCTMLGGDFDITDNTCSLVNKVCKMLGQTGTIGAQCDWQNIICSKYRVGC